jgi:hypothetical protein
MEPHPLAKSIEVILDSMSKLRQELFFHGIIVAEATSNK